VTRPRFNEPTWAKHYQQAWDDHVANSGLPLWFRVTALAYGNHAANGHANFRRGDIARLVGEFKGGELVPRDKTVIRDAIKYAVKHGLLDPSSCSECLVVPSRKVDGGGKDFKHGRGKPCPVHARKAATRKVISRRGSAAKRWSHSRVLEKDSKRACVNTLVRESMVGYTDPPGGSPTPTSGLEVGLQHPPRQFQPLHITAKKGT
jgi:hypothetical protein